MIASLSAVRSLGGFMISRKAKPLAPTLGVALALILWNGGPAAALELPPEDPQMAVWGSGPSNVAECTETDVASGCFQKYGDQIWVKDGSGDFFGTYVKWENWLRNANLEWLRYRSGECVNELDAPNWGVCNKDFYEHSTAGNAYGGTGSRIRIRACVSAVGTDPCTSWLTVYNNG
jgi:hypothetical protein